MKKLKNKLTIKRVLVILITLFIVGESLYLLLPRSRNLSNDAHRIITQCENTKDWHKCYGLGLASVNKTSNLEYTLSLLEKLESIQLKARDCHLLAHYISLSEVERNPKKWKDVLLKVDPNACTYGFIHGVLEGRTRFNNGEGIDKKTIENICTLLYKKSKKAGVDESCSHVMGHILLAEQQDNISFSISVCDSLSIKLQYMCFGGVFMEHFTRNNIVAHGVGYFIPWNNETIHEQESICLKYSGQKGQACWLEMAHLYSTAAKDNPSKTWQLCSQAPEKEFAFNCYLHAMGNSIKSHSTIEYKKEVCTPFANDKQRLGICFDYMATALIVESTKFLGDAVHFCNNLWSQEVIKECYRSVGRALHTYTNDKEQDKLCEPFTGDFKKYCLMKS